MNIFTPHINHLFNLTQAFIRQSFFPYAEKQLFVCYVFAPFTRDTISDEQRVNRINGSGGLSIYLITSLGPENGLSGPDVQSHNSNNWADAQVYILTFSSLVDKVCVKHLNAKSRPQNKLCSHVQLGSLGADAILSSGTSHLAWSFFMVMFVPHPPPLGSVHKPLSPPTCPLNRKPLSDFPDSTRFMPVCMDRPSPLYFSPIPSPGKRLVQLLHFFIIFEVYYIWSLIFHQTLRYFLLH